MDADVGESQRVAAAPMAGRRHGRAAAAAFATLACGVLLGWAAREQIGGPADVLQQLAEQAAQAPHGETTRVILHLSSGAPRDGLAVLERAEGILETARGAGRPVAVEIVANSGGLDLLREGVSAHAGRIASLRAAYPGLSLVACGQTAQRLREAGAEVRLLPGTVTATSALDQIVLRMQQGWAYVRI
jgi:intracellular sulfur oxidation DsrE/DsrF family protein